MKRLFFILLISVLYFSPGYSLTFQVDQKIDKPANYSGQMVTFSDVMPLHCLGSKPEIDIHPVIKGIQERRDRTKEKTVKYPARGFSLYGRTAFGLLNSNYDQKRYTGNTFNILIYDYINPQFISRK